MIYTVLFVPLSVAGGLFTAIALNRRVHGITFYRTAVFVPVVASTIATAIMFLWLFDPTFGLANWMLGKVGLGPFGFFDSPNGALYSIVGMTIWGWIGFNVIIYLAALQGIPQRAGRGGRDRRRRPVGPVPQHHAAAPGPGDAVPGGVVHDQRAAAVRRGVLPHARRPGARRRTSSSSTCSTSRSSRASRATRAAIAYVLFVAIMVLTVVQLLAGKNSSTTRHDRARRRRPRRAPAGGAEERRRFLFSPWHLVLVPLAMRDADPAGLDAA